MTFCAFKGDGPENGQRRQKWQRFDYTSALVALVSPVFHDESLAFLTNTGNLRFSDRTRRARMLRRVSVATVARKQDPPATAYETLEEMAKMAVFMASDKASGMIGTIVNLNQQGFNLTIPAHIRWRTRAVRYKIVLQLTVTLRLAGMTRRRLQS
jgi:hypothetical protein